MAINLSQEIIDYFKLRVRDLEATINLKLSAYRTTHEGYTDMTVYEPVFLQDENSLKILLQYSVLLRGLQNTVVVLKWTKIVHTIQITKQL